jgi:hypothetical protein
MFMMNDAGSDYELIQRIRDVRRLFVERARGWLAWLSTGFVGDGASLRNGDIASRHKARRIFD